MTSLYSQEPWYISKMYIVLTLATEYSCYYSWSYGRSVDTSIERFAYFTFINCQLTSYRNDVLTGIPQ